ncbi:tripartite tricarboxylate transporter TctB family protein [Advenella sp. WQ 585]|uniref:Tripartite tricarboxylate transporter TctB family protein n=1 Tax=Advenella mandrilli TaxID=2800330 RepID=A0ABS1E9M7_9BURK|nr:tripartite tricarboxylate transporter TctB family protein [Advenella mandrilli]
MPVLSNKAQAPVNTTSQSSVKPWWLGIVVVLMGVVCLYSASKLDNTARYSAIGPGMFVTAIGIGLVLLGLLLLIQIARGEKFEPQDTENAEGSTPMDKRAFFIALAAAFVPVFIIELLGLPVTAMVSFTLVTMAFGSKKIALNLIIGFILGSASWYLFSLLGLQLGEFIPLLGV